MKKFGLCISFFILSFLQVTAQVKVGLLLSDNFAKTGHEVTRQLNESVKGFRNDCEVRVYAAADLSGSDGGFLEQADLVFVYVHQAQVFEQAKPQLRAAMRKGARVYALGSTPAEDAYKEAGVIFNGKVLSYYDQGGVENLKNMILFRLDKDLALHYPYQDVIRYPEAGIYSPDNDTLFTDPGKFKSAYTRFRPGKPWVGIYMMRYELLNRQHRHIDTLIASFEQAGFNVLPFFGFPLSRPLNQFCIDSAGQASIDFLVTTSFLRGGTPEGVRKLFEKMGVPVINAIQLDQTKEEWESSKTGIGIFQRSLNLSQPELTGHIQPTVISSQEIVTTPEGQRFTEKAPLVNQIRQLAGRVRAWDNLRQKPEQEKNIALIYYNYPPGKDNIGASYLNVLPESIHHILVRMQKEGYDLGGIRPDSARLFDEIMDHGRNIGHWAPEEMKKLVTRGDPVLVPVSLYKQWFSTLSPEFREKVLEKWGTPEDADIMTGKNREGETCFVIPAVRYGRILLTPQPVRGWGRDPGTMYHDITLPPHHQYIAFYLYLRHGFHADAIVHLGTHGTHEWLPGKEAGLNEDDAPEALLGDLVNVYPYIVDNVGEGLQAKRRGMAVIIDHLTPPFDKAGLNPELHELSGLINDYNAALEKSSTLAGAKLTGITELAEKQGLLKDLGLDGALREDDIHELEHYIKEIAEKQSPMGLHSFGKSPAGPYAEATARAIVDRQQDLKPGERRQQILELKATLLASGESELNALMDALDGRYIPAGQGNDPLRNPASLPIGKNFYAFDPAKIPSPEVFGTGSRLAEELIEQYRQKHQGAFPDKVTFNLWSTETIRHEGIMESQIMKLLGVKPRYDAYGRTAGVELIPRKDLKRPRVDVVMVPSGLYRDLFPNLMDMLDQAVTLAAQQEEPDNHIRQHILSTRQLLIEQGIKDEEKAERLASVRMFSVPSGAYGTGLEDVIQASDTWDDEQQVADVYFNRMSHLYGQGFWGDKPEGADSALAGNFSLNLFKISLSGTKTVVHSRSSNMYGALDNDDFFQYLGGTAMAIRSIDGETPDVTVTNLSDPRNVGQESIDKFIGREMKSRYLNPKWINEMLSEGYAGARMVEKVVSHLWGWQVTVPEAVDENKWQQVYETYVEDKYQLDIKDKFREAGNLYAYQVALSRMLEVVRKDYWHPDDQVLETLVKEYRSTIEEAGLSCNENVCDNKRLTEFMEVPVQQATAAGKQLADAAVPANRLPGIPRKPEPASQEQVKSREDQAVRQPEKQIPGNKSEPDLPEEPQTEEVQGYKMEEAIRNDPAGEMKTDLPAKLGLALLAVLFMTGFFARKAGS